MTFLANEIGIETGRPAELYVFTTGSSIVRYTSGPIDVTIAANDYTAVVIQRTNTTEGVERREHDFQVVLPTTDQIAQLFVGILAGQRTFLTVSRYHLGDTPTPEVVTIFDGVILGASFAKNGIECTLAARPTLAAVGRTVPRRTCQASCNHVLYDALTCRVDDTDVLFRASALDTISQVGSVLTVDTLPVVFVDGYADSGFVEDIANGDFRLILSQTGDALTLLLPFATLPSSVNVFAGCDHTIDGASGCGPKFDNVEFFGGFPFTPTKNPFTSGL